MSFLHGTATFTRFSVNGTKPTMFDEGHLARLRLYAVKGDKRHIYNIDKHKTGWAGGLHIWDDVFDLEKNVYPDHLVFDFWHETDQLPSDRLKAYYEIDLRAHPKRTARAKKEARESSKERLEQEARDGRFKKWKCIPVLWDLIKNEVLFGSTSAGEVERFENLFIETFKRSLSQSEEYARGLQRIDAASLAKRIDWSSKSLMLTPFVKGGPEEARWAPSDNQPLFLGNEFVTWLIFETQTADDEFTVGDKSDIAVFFSGGIKLEHPKRKDNDTINAASAIRTPQAVKSMQAGYLPRKIALSLARHNQVYEFRLNAETFGVSSLKLPKVDDAVTDARGLIIGRFGLFREFGETFDLLYQEFVRMRVSNGNEWEQKASDIRDWLASKQPKLKAAGKAGGEKGGEERTAA